MLYKTFVINLSEAYGDREFHFNAYALCRDAAYGMALKAAKEHDFDFPIIEIREI